MDAGSIPAIFRHIEQGHERVTNFMGFDPPLMPKQEKIMKSMIAVHVITNYTCRNCGKGLTIEEPVEPDYIGRAYDKLPKFKSCYSCATGPMALDKADFRLIHNIFGDDKHGIWFCPFCKKDSYYPRIIRMAFKDFISERGGSFPSRANIALKTDPEPYVKLVKRGHPWRCPMCGNRMHYLDERYIMGIEDLCFV